MRRAAAAVAGPGKKVAFSRNGGTPTASSGSGGSGREIIDEMGGGGEENEPDGRGRGRGATILGVERRERRNDMGGGEGGKERYVTPGEGRKWEYRCVCRGLRRGRTKQGFGVVLAFTFLRRMHYRCGVSSQSRKGWRKPGLHVEVDAYLFRVVIR